MTKTRTLNKTNFKKDLDIIVENADITIGGEIRFRMRKYQRIEKMPIEVMDLSTRSHNGLRRNGINTIDDVLNKWDRLPMFRGLGDNCVKEIKMGVISLYYDTLDDKEKKVFWKDAFGRMTEQKGA